MCYHNSLTADKDQLELNYKAEFKENADWKPIYHSSGFGSRLWPIITNEESNVINLFSWALVPHWSTAEDIKNGKFKVNTLNAKGETIFEKPSFRDSILKRRCLVPSTGFFEWQHRGEGKSAEKIPHYIQVRDQQIFSMAGIWSRWADRSGSGVSINSFSIITTEATGIMAEIHNSKKRMPVILSKEQEQLWLNDSLGREEIAEILKPYDTSHLTAYTISKRITSKDDTNVPEVIGPCAW